MKKKINKEKTVDILIFLLMLMASISIILLKRLDDLDELWNYNFARNISMGLIPYKEFSMIVTPLFSFIGGIILKLTVDKLIVMRISAAILTTTILFVSYKIFSILNVKKQVSIIFLAIMFLLFQNLISFDYNWTLLLITLIILYNELKLYTKNNNIFEINHKYDLLIGILSGMAFLCKQTAGLLIAFIFVTNKIIFIHKSKENFKIFCKIVLYRTIGVLIPIIVCFIYLAINQALGDFISYAVKGTREFSNYYFYTNLIEFDAVGFLAILLPVTIITEIILLLLKNSKTENYLMLVYSLAMAIVVFPISDAMHFIIGATPTIVLFFYGIYSILLEILRTEKRVIKILCIYFSTAIILFAIFYIVNNCYKYIKCKDYFSNVNQYQYTIIPSETKKMLDEVDAYVLNSQKDIKVLEASAVLYMIPIGRYNKDYDMFNKGNFGENGENKLIEDIKNSKNRQYLVLKDKYVLNWQTPTKVVDYVKENKNKVGEVSIYDIYE